MTSSPLILAIVAVEDYFQHKIMQDTPTPIAEIDHGPSKLDQFLEKYQKALVILAILLFLGILGYVFYIKYEEMKDQQAGAALSAATTEEQYRAVIEQYGDRTAAGTAALAIADLRTTDKDAIEALEYFITTYPDHPNISKAKLQLALRQINSDMTGEAQATLESIISNDPEGYLVPMAKIALGDIASKNSEIDKAKALYTEAQNLNPEINAFAQIATTRLAFLSAKLPEVVEAAPASTPAPTGPNVEPSNMPFGPDGVNEQNMQDLLTPPDTTEVPDEPQTPEQPEQTEQSDPEQP